MYSVTCVYSEFRRTKRSLPAPGSERVTVLSPREPQLGTPGVALTGRRRLQWSRPELSRILEETERRYYGPESIEWFIEGQAFSQSYDLAPRSPHPPSPVRKTEKERKIADGRGGKGGFAPQPPPPPSPARKIEKEKQIAGGRGRDGGGWGAESYERKKIWSSINHSILILWVWPLNT